MVALSATKERISKEGKRGNHPVAASTKIYKGSHVMVDAGYAKPSATGAASYGAGFAEKTVDNSGGADGDKTVPIDKFEVVKVDGFTGLAITDVGKTAYASDDDTFSIVQGNDIPVGKIWEWISSTTAMVKVEFGGVSI